MPDANPVLTAPLPPPGARPKAAPLPWYRHPWPWLLMAGPILVVVAGFYTLYLAVVTSDGLVADDYYKRGLAINQTLERGERASALGLYAIVDVQPDGTVRVELHSAAPQLAAAPARLRVSLSHPTHAGSDRSVELARGPDGAYTGQIGPFSGGRRWLIVETDAWRLPPHATDGDIRAVRLDANPVPAQ